MKKVSNTIRIGMVRRGSPSSKLHEDKLSSIGPEQTNHRLVNKQDFSRPISVLSHDLQKETINNLHEIPSKTNWFTPKKILVGGSTAAIVGSVIVVSTVLAVVLTRPTGTTSTTSTTTISPTIVTAYWSFDNTATDLYGVYNGQLVNTPIYTPAGSSSIPYVGSGRALTFLSATSQSVAVSTFFDLSYTSFTIEAWIYPSLTSGDRGIFGQCQCSTCANQCLYFIIRSGHLYIGFTSNDLLGTITISNNNWYHVALVYNYQTQQQILYVNGVQDAIKSNAQPYQGQNGTIQIGSTQVYSATNYFNGYIDNLLVTTQAKSGDDILRDASLFAYYSFDLPDPNADSGPNRLNGTSTNTVTTTGRVNQAMRLIGTGSYFQVYGFYNVPYGVNNNRPFSISMWINPTSGNNCTFVQLFPTSLSTFTCVNLLGISAASSTAAQIFVQSSNNGPSLLTGPFVTQNKWTHISLTFSSTVGYTLYVNGIVFGATGTGSYALSGTFAYFYIGYNNSCNAAAVNTGYQGAIDEVYIHNRELTQADITDLSNP